jgi:acyl-coenzyme A synthetase/AMP-(fatty) acid ligase
MLQDHFLAVRKAIADERFDDLATLPLQRHTHFNWYAEVFEGICLNDHPDATALIWTDGTREERHTYRDLGQRTDRLLAHLRAEGIGQGAVIYTQVALELPIWDAHLAAIKGGLQLIPAATVLAVPDIVHRFTTVLPDVVLADATTAPVIDAALRTMGKEVRVKLLIEGELAGWTPYTAVTAAPHVPQTAVHSGADDPLFLFFTNGTTGMPKVVVHTHLSYPLGHLTTASWIGMRPGEVHYNISQPGWGKFAWSSFFAPLSMGATIFAFHPPGRFNANEQFRMMAQHRVTTFCAPPTALRLLIQHPPAEWRHSLRQCVAAGEPLNPEVIEAWRAITGLTLRDGYGQTESTCMVANLPGCAIKPGSMGHPTYLYDIVIADDEGRILPADEEGNICVRTGGTKPNGIFHHYLADEAKMRSVFKHGLYYTGDKAYQDEAGYIWFVGRDDDVIKASDHRVGPFEVESVLLEHAAVLESAVVGSPHAVRGYEVKAFVVLAAGHTPSEELARTLFQHARERMAPYKLPRLIEFVTELPKTMSGKIRRVELRGMEADRKAKGIKGPHEYSPGGR